MKKQFLTIIVLLLFFAIFNCLQITDKNEFNSKILKVVDGDEFYIDFNGNGKIEENELSKLADIKVFSSSKNKEIEDDILSLNISFQDYLKLGLLAESWAIKNLENKDVKVKILSRFPINLVEIEFDDKNLSQHLLELGLGYIDNSSDLYIYQNNSQIKKNLEKLTSDKYLILNLKSNIFHELSCKIFS